MSDNNSKTLTRAEIAEKIQEQLGLSFSEAMEILDNIITETCDQIAEFGNLKISSFGTFMVNEKKERVGRNPKTKEEAVISARKVVSFYSSNHLNDEVN